ncbi:alpha-N-acetylgalactosaminidase-like [Glandiceps talaboti]
MIQTMKIQLLSLLLCAHCVVCMDNGLARTPPMGWMDWERFRCNTDCANDPNNCIGEKLFRDMADEMAINGYKDVGYEYVCIDDCWMSMQRDSHGNLYANTTRFPSGIKALADYIHSKGLKLGIYEDYGTHTCGGYPGSIDYLQQDAQTFADWGVDYLKFDGCYAQPSSMDKGYPQMTQALNSTGRPMVFSCSWPDYQRAQGMKPNYTLIGDNCNLWRNYADVQDSWDSVSGIIDYYKKEQKTLAAAQGPGKWNDPDMLIIGDYGLSYDQSKVQMAMWAMFSAPLMMSTDLRTISNESSDILLNKEVIAVNQDALGKMGTPVTEIDGVEVWVKEMMYDGRAVVFMNRHTDGTPRHITVKLKDLGFDYMMGYEVRDIFDHIEMGHIDVWDVLKFTINPTGVVMIYAYPSE